MADPTRGPIEPAASSSARGAPSLRPSTPAPQPPIGIWARIQRHKVMQWTLGYAALAYTLLHTTEMVSDALAWPHLIARVLTIVLLLAVPIVVLLAWYHGHKGEHRISTGELSLLTVLLLLGAGLLWAFTRSGTHAPAQPQEAAAPAAPAASVAVVPFANLTGEISKEYFSDGMAEELIHELARVPGLKVPARTSSFAYKGRNVDIRQIAHDLGVASILEGSVRSAGDRIRVTAQLVNAQSGYDLWSQTYDRDFGDVFKLEDEISAEIVEALKMTLNAQLPAAIAQAPPTRDPEAYRLYLQAEASNSEAALRLTAQAIARDPQFARAFALSASRRALVIAAGGILPNALQDTERDANRALALDPNLPQAHSALAILNAWQGNWVAAESYFRKAVELDPNDADIRLSHASALLDSAGQLHRALQEVQKAYALAPSSGGVVTVLAASYTLLGLDQDALKYADLAADLGDSSFLLALTRSNVALRSGRFDEAATDILPTLPDKMRLGPGSDVVTHVFRAFGEPGKRAAASRSLTALLHDPTLEGVGVSPRLQVLTWYVKLEDLNGAFDFANRSLDEFARYGSIGPAWGGLWLPEMRPFRRDSRFRAFVARMKLPDYWKEYGPPDDCDFKDGKLACR